MYAIFVVHLDEVRQVVYACAVDEGHLAHTDNLYARFLAVNQIRLQIIELIGNTEEVWTVDFIDGTTLRNHETLVLEVHIGFVAGVNLVLDNRNLGGLHHTFDKEGAGNDEAHFYGDGEVENDGEQERYNQYDYIALGVAKQTAEGTPTTHVIADDNQYGSQRGHGDVFGIWHQQ